MKLFDFFSTKKVVARGGKDFVLELDRFVGYLRDLVNFSLVRFGDGEMKIINGVLTDYSHKRHAEHTYIPDNERDEQQRKLLKESLLYQNQNYFVGIACPCCVGREKFYALKTQSQQNENRLTWANIFVNSNFPRLEQELYPQLTKREIIFVGNKAAEVSGLPFPVKRVFSVGSNAWLEDYQLVRHKISEYIQINRVENHVFIFCAGVLSNILICALHKQYPSNTYLDMGSVFDVELGLGKTRKYLKRGKTLKRTCVWG